MTPFFFGNFFLKTEKKTTKTEKNYFEKKRNRKGT